MTPESRAEALFKRICALGKIHLGYNPEGEAEAVSTIAAAIRDALDDYAALQEIKVAALHRAYQDMLKGQIGFVPHANSLKSPSPPKETA